MDTRKPVFRAEILEFKGNDKVGGFVGITGGAEDYVFVVAEGMQPGVEIGGMGAGIVAKAALGHKDDAGEFRAQLLLRVCGIAERVCLVRGFTGKVLRMTAPMGVMPISA